MKKFRIDISFNYKVFVFIGILLISTVSVPLIIISVINFDIPLMLLSICLLGFTSIFVNLFLNHVSITGNYLKIRYFYFCQRMILLENINLVRFKNSDDYLTRANSVVYADNIVVIEYIDQTGNNQTFFISLKPEDMPDFIREMKQKNRNIEDLMENLYADGV